MKTRLQFHILALLIVCAGAVADAQTIQYGSGFTSTGLTLNKGAAINGTRLRLTDGGTFEARSAFFSTPVNVTSFTNAFTFQDTSAKADGLCFVIEASGPAALGGSGGALGYAGTTGALSTKSLCVDFDLFNGSTNKEISNTGLFTNGANPSHGAGSAAGSLSFQSGDVMSVQMTYNGTTLTMQITDTVTSATYNTSFTVNIPSAVGGNTAYVGFTGGTGGLTAIQDILTWTYTSGSSQSQAATPTITPGSGTETSPVTVTLTDSTPNATITYTTDGSTPVPGQHGTAASSGASFSLSFTSTPTVQAIASASGFSNSATATATYTLPISVSISPASASVQVGQSQQFTAAVSGTTNTAVNWLVAGILGGSSSVGTISSTGLYTAPSIAPTNAVTVTAQSTSNLSASANATVTITSIPENQEKAFIYVDPNTGNNSNPGTQAKPLKTVQAAASIAFDNNKNNVGTRVTLNPGTYRENVYYNTPSTSAPVTFQAAQNGTAIITGSDLWTDWTSAGNIFTHNWPYTWGECALPNGWPSMWPIILRREMIFVNGTPLTQVISANQMVEGTFYVDDASHLVSMWPPSGTNMSTAAIEVAVRPGTFNIQSATNVVLRGITFEHASTCPQTGNSVTVTSSNHILIDTDNFLWNNQAGLGLTLVNNVVVQNSVANHNGSGGIAASQGKDHNYYNNETSYNNWREAMGAYYGWSYDGAKILLMHTADFNGFKAYYNQTGGIWFDTDNKNITLENLDSSNNLTMGMFLEADEGPITITDSKFCNNNDNEDSTYSFGTLISGNAEYVTVSGSLFYNNAVPDFGGEIFIGGTSAGRTFKDWETGQTYTVQSQNWTLNGNTVVGVGSLQDLFYSYQTGSVWNLFQSTFSSNNNTWWNASNANVFHPEAGVFDFSKWHSYMGQDANSTFSDPGVSCAPPKPDYPDYWLTTYFGGDKQTVTRGASASYTIQIFPVGAFTGTVDLSVDGVTQIGATSSLGAQSILTSGSTTLTVNTSGSTSVGTFPITVIANSGSVVRTLTLTLTVQ